VSGPDGDADLAAEDMLKRIEQEEARAMRDELLGLLQSDVCRNALDEMMRRPMETALGNALNGPAMQAKIRELIAAALKPEIKSAIETATAEALKPLTVMLSPAQEQRLTNLGQKTIADAVTQSQTNAAGAIDTIGKTVTSLRDGLLKELREVKTAAALPAAALSTAGVPSTGMSTGTSAAGMPAAGSTEFAGAPVVKPAKGNWWNLEWRVTLSWRMVSLWLGGMAVVAILAYGLIAIVASIYRDPLTAAPSQSSSTTASLASTTPPASPDQPDTPSSPETAADEPSATEALPPAATANLRAVVGRYLLEITKRG